VFSLRGKPLNCYGLTKKIVYQNEEFNLLQHALNIEDSLDDLRYNRVVIATDADVDGMHIRLLLLTFFLQFFPDLVRNGHLYILDTPLFRVRDKQQTFYCYSESKNRRPSKNCAANPKSPDSKGLGEISPNEFGAFIGETCASTRSSCRKTPTSTTCWTTTWAKTRRNARSLSSKTCVELDIVEEIPENQPEPSEAPPVEIG
jgi:DNA gyrase/topoisomerase IV subunit B